MTSVKGVRVHARPTLDSSQTRRRLDDAGRRKRDRNLGEPRGRRPEPGCPRAGALSAVGAFFIPTGTGRAGEDAYQRLRRRTEVRMGRPPATRRISELWTRRGSLDCVTVVGAPDPVCGDIVVAIFDMGPRQPFVVYRQDPADPEQPSCEVLGCSAYSISEFDP
jgi:hypothetical protein